MRDFNKLLMLLSTVDSLMIFVEIGETSIIGTFLKSTEVSELPYW
jgi:hypothetical protein